MPLLKYIERLDEAKRVQLVGNDTDDVKHAAFPKKSVVHAGLFGAGIPKEREQEAWAKAMAETADGTRRHAIYVHIPFCQTKCIYCGFYQNASKQETEDRYIDCLLAEMERERGSRQMETAKIDAVFFGGGTPTSLSAKNAARLLSSVQAYFRLAEDAEVTMEGRIHDLVPEKIETWLANGVNRISLGVQSFDTETRRRVGRIDAKEEVLRRLELLRRYDVTIICDLIYGLPGQTREIWMEDVRTLLTAPVDGMDLYQLNVFQGGDLARALQAGRVPACADIGGQADYYAEARDFLLQAGFERLSLCHWRRSARERSRYNTLAKTGAVVHPYGCGAGGNVAGLAFMQEREIAPYEAAVRAGKKPVMMMGRQVEEPLRSISDAIIADLEKGFVDFQALVRRDERLSGLSYILELWRGRRLMRESLGMYRLTEDGEFWYVTMTQSLVECAQALLAKESGETLTGAEGEDDLARALAELLPEASQEALRRIAGNIPAHVQKMIQSASRESLQSMLAGMPPAMRDSMLRMAER